MPIQMGISDFFGFAKKDKVQESELNEPPLLSLLTAAQFLKEAHACLNPKDGPEFIAGIRGGFIPLQQRVMAHLGKETGYGDTLQEFARLTRDDPERYLKTLQTLASQMRHAPACGVRFLIADLILAYARVGAYPHGSIESLLKLQEVSLAILEAGSAYG